MALWASLLDRSILLDLLLLIFDNEWENEVWEYRSAGVYEDMPVLLS